MFQTHQSYAKVLTRLIQKANHQIVILIDSVDKLSDIKDIDWLPSELVNNVKIILTVTSATNNTDDFESLLLKALTARVNAQNFLFLTSFTQEQWEDVLAGSSNGALQLPEAWKKSDEKVPIEAKVKVIKSFLNLIKIFLFQILWWLAWLGQRKLENLSISHISEKVFEILESKFGVTKVKYLITLIIASRDGLLETEIVDLLQGSKIIEGERNLQILSFN
jgi:Cdc6-like AAA superfamily ATPase